MNLRKTILNLLGTRLPKTQGKVSCADIGNNIQITRDAFGVPTINAASEKDAYYGLGFCQGQDRCFQIQMLSRLSQGRVSEWIGKRGINIDRFMRRIGFYRSAKKQFEKMDPVSKAIVQSFVNGLNAGWTLGLPQKPHELVLLRTQAETFDAVDIISMMSLLSFMLPCNWDKELSRLSLALHLSPEALQQIEPSYPSWLNLTQKEIKGLTDCIHAFEEDLKILLKANLGGGSNNWVLDGTRTASRKPLLANDPHLGPMTPAPWYLAHMNYEKVTVSGASFSGIPIFLCAHNGFAAWGLTHAYTDIADWFIEKEEPREVIEEVIQVKNSKPVIEKIKITPRGPIVFEDFDNKGLALSLSATHLLEDSVPKLPRLQYSTSFETFREEFRGLSMMPLNMVYADTKGDIGWQLVGEVPKRKSGYGLIPLPAWVENVGWEKKEDFDLLPYCKNPMQGFFATANTKPDIEAFDCFVGCDWNEEFRYDRIKEALKKNNQWTVEDCFRLQYDVYSKPFERLKPILEKIKINHPQYKKLLNWDGNLFSVSTEATLFITMFYKINQKAVHEKITKGADVVLGKGFGGDLFPWSHYSLRMGWLIELLEKEEWFQSRTQEMVIRESFIEALEQIEKTFGKIEVGWGRARLLRFGHFLSSVPFIGKFFELGPIPGSGDSFTVSQSALDPFNVYGDVIAIANLRAVFDLSDLSKTKFTLAGGVSGNPSSKHYNDLFEKWVEKDPIPLKSTGIESELLLVPHC